MENPPENTPKTGARPSKRAPASVTDDSDLIEKHLSGTISEAEMAALNAALAESPEARQELRAAVRVHGALADHFSEEDVEVGYRPITQIPQKPRRSVFSYAAAAAILAMFLGSGVIYPALEKADVFAEILEADQAEWADMEVIPAFLKGRTQWLENRHHLISGLVELGIGEHVRVAVEGPSEFILVDETRIQLLSGKISAHVTDPAGHGFIVETPQGEVIDLGTRFGVSVDAAGMAEAHVFEGEIAVTQGDETLRLTDEEAIQLDAMRPMASEPWAFPMTQHRLSVTMAAADFPLGTVPGSGMPKTGGVWSGDEAIVVERSGEDGMLQFLASGNVADSPEIGRVASELWQILDLRDFASEVNAGGVSVDFSGQFNRVTNSENSEFKIGLTAFRGDPSSVETYWDRKSDPTSERLVSTQSTIVTDAIEHSWETASLAMSVPAGTDFLLATVMAFEDAGDRVENEFAGHFADDLELRLTAKAQKSQPTAVLSGRGAAQWSDASSWREGHLPDPGLDRVVVESSKMSGAILSTDVAIKQSLTIAMGNDTYGNLVIAEHGKLTKSGNGELIVGFNRGAEAILSIKGELVTRSPAFIGRNNSLSSVLIDGGSWDATGTTIRMAQYGDGAEETLAMLLIDDGGVLRADRLEMIHDETMLKISDGLVEISERLTLGGNNGSASVSVVGGILRVGELRFGPAKTQLVIGEGGELWVAGAIETAELVTLAESSSIERGLDQHDGETFTVFTRKKSR